MSSKKEKSHGTRFLSRIYQLPGMSIKPDGLHPVPKIKIMTLYPPYATYAPYQG
jgi:hypothetical protein